jgi:outer membrane protein assembly factor BamB
MSEFARPLPDLAKLCGKSQYQVAKLSGRDPTFVRRLFNGEKRASHLCGPDPATGAERWQTESDEIISKAIPVIVDGTLYIPSDDHLFAIDMTLGDELWRFPITGSKLPVVIDERISVPGRDTLHVLGNIAASSDSAEVGVGSSAGKRMIGAE